MDDKKKNPSKTLVEKRKYQQDTNEKKNNPKKEKYVCLIHLYGNSPGERETYLIPRNVLSDEEYEWIRLLNKPLLGYLKDNIALAFEPMNALYEVGIAMGWQLESSNKKALNKEGAWKKYKIEDSENENIGEICMLTVLYGYSG